MTKLAILTILEELKQEDYERYVHLGGSRFSEADWDWLIDIIGEKIDELDC